MKLQLKKSIIKRKTENKVFGCAKKYLKRGIYIFENKKIMPLKNKKYLLRIYKIHIVFCNKSEKEYSSIEYDHGSDKYIVLLDECVVAFFKSEYLYNRAKESYLRYKNKIVYPIAKTIGFDDNNRTVIMERIYGRQYHDRDHDMMVISELFKYALLSPIKKDCGEKCYYLQHSDAWRDNIIWQNDSSFVFIDTDLFSYKPLLFDIIYYCEMSGMSLEEIVLILTDNYCYFEKIYKRFNLTVDTNFLDLVFYDFAYEFIRMGNYLNNINFCNYSEQQKNCIPAQKKF